MKEDIKEHVNRSYLEQLLANAKKEQEERDRELWDVFADTADSNYARWATEEEMMRTLTAIVPGDEEVSKAGVPILCKDGVVYTDASDSHTLIIGASGSKKSRLVIMPTILNLMKAGESMIVTDPKAELYERTSGRLKEKGYRVYCINFRDESCMNSWNPLYAPREFFAEGKADLAIGLLNDFCAITVPKDMRSVSDPFWDDQSRALLMGLLLLMFQLASDPEEINIRGILRMRNGLLANREKSLAKINKHLDPGSLIASYLSSLAVMPEKTYGSVLATFDTHLMKFIQRPSLTDMLCSNDVDFHRIGKEKTAVFLVMPDEKTTYHGLVSIFIQQCYESLIYEAQKMEKKSLPVRVNFLLDEFSSLPPIREFPAMIAAARSRNIRVSIVVQSEKQLVYRYQEEAETLKGNCNNWIFLYSRELSMLEELGRICGLMKNGKPLVTPVRLQRLSKSEGEALVIHEREYPFLTHLDDISEYDHDCLAEPAYEEMERNKIKVFNLEEALEGHSTAWLKSALAGNRAESEAEAEREKKQKRRQREEEDKKLVEGATKFLADRLKKAEAQLKKMSKSAEYFAVPCCFASGADADLIRETSGRMFERWKAGKEASTEELFSVLLRDREPNIEELKHGTEEKREEGAFIGPAEAFPLAMLPRLVDINRNSFLIIGDDRRQELVTRVLWEKTLAAGERIPVYMNMADLRTECGDMTEYQDEEKQEGEKRKTWNEKLEDLKWRRTLLVFRMASALFDVPMPEPYTEEQWKYYRENKEAERPKIEGPLDEYSRLLMKEFSREGTGQPQYLVLLQGMEKAASLRDAAYMSRMLASLPNVQVAAVTSDSSFGWKNPTVMPNAEVSAESKLWPISRMMLYFDEDRLEVLSYCKPLFGNQLECIDADQNGTSESESSQ